MYIVNLSVDKDHSMFIQTKTSILEYQQKKTNSFNMLSSLLSFLYHFLIYTSIVIRQTSPQYRYTKCTLNYLVEEGNEMGSILLQFKFIKWEIKQSLSPRVQIVFNYRRHIHISHTISLFTFLCISHYSSSTRVLRPPLYKTCHLCKGYSIVL